MESKIKITPAKKVLPFARIPTQDDRDFMHLLFQNYCLRTRENLLKRIEFLKWNPATLEKLEELGFIAKPSWEGTMVYYERKLFRLVTRSDD